jgi:hypothetical protein
MRKIGSYVAELLELVTPTKDVFAPQRWAGYDIKLFENILVNACVGGGAPPEARPTPR